jgi:hypothetical protein
MTIGGYWVKVSVPVDFRLHLREDRLLAGMTSWQNGIFRKLEILYIHISKRYDEESLCIGGILCILDKTFILVNVLDIRFRYFTIISSIRNRGMRYFTNRLECSWFARG